MFVVMHNLYGIKDKNDERKVWYKNVGSGCFGFVGDKKYASDMTKEECEKVIQSSDYYCKMFNASHMSIEEN